jgi:hypothetical protein
MKKHKYLGKLRNFLHIMYFSPMSKKTCIEEIKDKREYYTYNEAIAIIEKNNVNEETVRLIYNEQVKLKEKSNRFACLYQAKIVHRDNKDIINGTGCGGNRNPIRYPSKKRSRQTWGNFYKLFPRLAEKDNWDGKKSDKMK